MSTATERDALAEQAEYLRTIVSTWVSGPRYEAVMLRADQLDALAKGEPLPTNDDPGVPSTVVPVIPEPDVPVPPPA